MMLRFIHRLYLALLLTTYYLLLTTPLAYAAPPDCTVRADNAGANNFVLFSPNNIDKDCGAVPLDGNDPRFQYFISKEGSTIIPTNEINNQKLIHQFFDRDKPSFWNFFQFENSTAVIDLTANDLFPNTCLPPEALTDPNFKLSDYYKASYAGFSSRHPANQSALSQGVEIGTQAERDVAYANLGHSLLDGQANILDANPLDKASLPENEWYELRRWCIDYVQACHNHNQSRNGIPCQNDFSLRAANPEGATAFSQCQILPRSAEEWLKLGETADGRSRRARMAAAIHGTKAVSTVYFLMVWNQDDSDKDAFRDYSKKAGELWGIGKFHICGAPQTAYNEKERVRMYTIPEQYQNFEKEVDQFINCGQKITRIPNRWKAKYEIPTNGFQSGMNMIIDAVNEHGCPTVQVRDLGSQFSGAMSPNAQDASSAKFQWVKSLFAGDGATPFSQSEEESKQVYNGWFIMDKHVATLHAIETTGYSQLRRYQSMSFSKEDHAPRTVAVPNTNGAATNDAGGINGSPPCTTTTITNADGSTSTVTDCEELKSGTDVLGFRNPQLFFGGSLAHNILTQVYKWLQPINRAPTDCHHTSLVDTDPSLLGILKAAYSGAYDTFAGATNCPDEPLSTLGKTPSQELNSGSICAVAEKHGIPCCQLLGIMNLETGYVEGQEPGGGSGSCSNTPQACCTGIGCGPAQLTCGQISGFKGNDKNLNACDPVDAAELLSRAMKLKLCQADGKCGTYDWAKEESIASKYTISEGDYIAAGYFHGAVNGCNATGCTQYRWGDGKSYCSAVEYYCQNNQTIPDARDSNFCEACSREVVNSGLPPLVCQ